MEGERVDGTDVVGATGFCPGIASFIKAILAQISGLIIMPWDYKLFQGRPWSDYSICSAAILVRFLDC